jgi:hypothetical protein
MGKRTVEVSLCPLKLRRRCPKKPLCILQCIDRSGIVSGEKSSLHFSDPIPALGDGQRRIACKVILEPTLVELLVVKRTKFWLQPTQRSYEPQLGTNDVNDQTEPGPLHKFEPILGFALYFRERVPAGEHMCVQIVAAIASKGKISVLACSLEGAAHQIAAGRDMFCPRHHAIAEKQVRGGLKALKSELFNKLVGKLTEFKACFVVAKARPGY